MGEKGSSKWGGVDEFGADSVSGGGNATEGVSVRPKTIEELTAIAAMKKLAREGGKGNVSEMPADPDLAGFLASGSDDAPEPPKKISQVVESPAVDPFDDYATLGPAQTPDIDAGFLEKEGEDSPKKLVNSTRSDIGIERPRMERRNDPEFKGLEDKFIAILAQDRRLSVKEVNLERKGKLLVVTILCIIKDEKGKKNKSFRISGDNKEAIENMLRTVDLGLQETKKGRGRK